MALEWNRAFLVACRTMSSARLNAIGCSPSNGSCSGVGDGRDPLGGAIGIDRVGPLPHQAERDGRDAAVALTGRTEGAEQFDGDPLRRVERPVLRQTAGEPVGGDHRADGV